MEKRKKNYNLVIGVVALVVVILIIAVSGYFVSRPKPMVVYGEAEAGEYRGFRKGAWQNRGDLCQGRTGGEQR